MRIAIPVGSGNVSSALGLCEAFQFYEDDHGRIVRRFSVPMEETGIDAAIILLERYGIDALVCGAISEDETRAVAGSGIMFFPGAAGPADDAALAFLHGAIAFDESNTCTACGNVHACSMDCKSCSLKHE